MARKPKTASTAEVAPEVATQTVVIRNRFSGDVIFTASVPATIKGTAKVLGAAVLAALVARANLSRANLSGANLSGANLSGANLSRANLSGANLSGADLYGANLSGANLSRADLYGANLSGADLYGANLSGANLSRADLYGANLSGANLSGANLSGANLVSEVCDTCKGAGMVWARALAFPVGLRRFVGGRWNRHDDGVHVEVPCPACYAGRAALTTNHGGE